MNDVVNKDLTRTHLNQHKDEVQKGGKVTILRKGYVVTNAVTGTPTAGGAAYASPATAGNVDTSGTYQIGRFYPRRTKMVTSKSKLTFPEYNI